MATEESLLLTRVIVRQASSVSLFQGGKGRTGVVIAAYMHFSKICSR